MFLLITLAAGCTSAENKCSRLSAVNELENSAWLNYTIQSGTGEILNADNVTLAPQETYDAEERVYGKQLLKVRAQSPVGAFEGNLRPDCNGHGAATLRLQPTGIQAIAQPVY